MPELAPGWRHQVSEEEQNTPQRVGFNNSWSIPVIKMMVDKEAIVILREFGILSQTLVE